MQDCPKCGSPRVRRSRSKGLFEKMRKGFTHKRPLRCHACGWRGWGLESGRRRDDRPSAQSLDPVPDLAAIDIAIGLEREETRRTSRRG